MPEYQKYPTAAEMPSRKQRKAKRKAIFAYNRAQGNVERRARRDARKEKANG